jgi:toxin YoeB
MSKKKLPLELNATEQAHLDIEYWMKSGNQKIVERINKLITAALTDPANGIGKPERLRFYRIETYSRRIDRTHRLIYRVEEGRLVILAARFHYHDK